MPLDHSKITKLIVNNRHKLALQEMSAFTAQYATEYSIEVAAHLTNLNSLNRNQRIGITSYDEHQRGIAKLTMAILTLLDDLKDKSITKDDSTPTNQQDSKINIEHIEVKGGTVQIADILNNINQD